MIISPYAILAASNISIFVLFLISFLFMSGVLRDETKGLSLRKKVKLFFTDSVFRAPFGFMTMTSGLLIRLFPGTFLPVLNENQMYDTIARINTTYLPLMASVGEWLIFAGFVIIFWPTLKKINIKHFGPGLGEATYNGLTMVTAAILKILLTVFGIGIYYIFTM